MVDKIILHYKILEKLGEGGMGVVYLAEDTRLERKVAIKFLPRHIAANAEDRQRFEIEAKAAAALNHPNIATIYAIEESDDEMFIVMEYIEGRELRDVITNAGVVGEKHTQQLISSEQDDVTRNVSPLPVDQIINIAVQIAAGLQVAHEKGIVHRDIKSANIMLTGKGQVKIMDFGLAKVAGGGAQLTKDQSTVGTAAYMSPEQARGEEVDFRSDIWSFGVVLYEMLTGRLPFGGFYFE
jgi:serine/threonine protein kinase